MTDKAMSSADELLDKDILSIVRYGRYWAVYDNRSGCDSPLTSHHSYKQQSVKQQTAEQLVCLTVYKKGAHEVVRRLEAAALKTDEG